MFLGMDCGTGRLPACATPVLLLLTAALVFAQDAQSADRGKRRECLQTKTCSSSDEPASRADGQLAHTDPALDRNQEAPVYRPPRRGAPRTKIGGGVRTGLALPELCVLTPDHLAETTSIDPSLFWHIDSVPADSAKLVFTLIDEVAIDPLVEVVLPALSVAGIQRIRLADHGVELDPQMEYEWSVSLVVDPEDRTHDVVSAGFIRRVEPPLEPVSTTAAYAELGLWYDALESISDAIEASPRDAGLLAQRAALLRQAGLESAIE
jgi:hypothetical protein